MEQVITADLNISSAWTPIKRKTAPSLAKIDRAIRAVAEENAVDRPFAFLVAILAGDSAIH